MMHTWCTGLPITKCPKLTWPVVLLCCIPEKIPDMDEMDAHQVASRLAQTGLTETEKQAVRGRLVSGSINPAGWVFVSDAELTQSLRNLIQPCMLPACLSSDSFIIISNSVPFLSFYCLQSNFFAMGPVHSYIILGSAPVTRRLTKSIYVVCESGYGAACGTCFVVSSTLLLTAYHNLSLTTGLPQNWSIASGLSRDARGLIVLENPIPVKVFCHSMQGDWALLSRDDNLQFDPLDVVPICSAPLPEPETHITVCHCALDIFRDGRVSAAKPMAVDARVGFYSKHKMFFQVGLFGGSSGGLIALPNGTALGMHLDGVNAATLAKVFCSQRQAVVANNQPLPVEDDITLASDSNEQATGVLSEGLVICKYKRIVQEL
jgi:hypothetical protein